MFFPCIPPMMFDAGPPLPPRKPGASPELDAMDARLQLLVLAEQVRGAWFVDVMAMAMNPNLTTAQFEELMAARIKSANDTADAMLRSIEESLP